MYCQYTLAKNLKKSFYVLFAVVVVNVVIVVDSILTRLNA
jgi:hypothetical protein